MRDARQKVVIALRRLLLLGILGLSAVNFQALADPPTKDYYRIVVLSDLHLPGSNYAAKETMLDMINSASDVDLVVALGDICLDNGNPDEYQIAKAYFGKLKVPLLCPVVGNHDYLYEDLKKDGKRVRALPEIRAAKLERFKKTFSLTELYYSKRVGSYLFIFLSTDELYNSYLTAISAEQLEWLNAQLHQNRNLPTIIFFHAPLEGTLTGNNSVVKDLNYMAQPRAGIKSLLAENPQVFLWVSGHDHLAPTNAAFNHPLNLYQHQVYNLHCPNLSGSSFLSEDDWSTKKHSLLWANSLYLYPDKVRIRTYDFTNQRWLTEHDRVIRPNILDNK